MVPVERPADAGDALVLIDATSGAGGLPLDRRARRTPITSPRRRASAPTAGCGWRCSARPRSRGSSELDGADGRWQPAFLSLATALENSRKDQTYNTPAVATLLLLADQLEWMLELGRARLVRRALRGVVRPPLRLGRARASSRRRSSPIRPSARSVVGTIDFDDGGRRRRARRDPARERDRRRRAVPQARPQPAADRDVPGDRPGRRRGADRLHRLGGRERARGRADERRSARSTDDVPRVLVKEKIADAGVELLRADFDVELGLDWDRGASSSGGSASSTRS